MRQIGLAVFLLVAGVATHSRAANLPSTLVDPYLRVQTALAADKTDTLQRDAAEIVAAATQLGDAAKPIADAAHRLGRAGTLAAARDTFGPLSDAVLAYAKKTGATLTGEVKVAYCSMADKSWLQKGETIQNPYFGSEMLECGEWKK